MKTKLYACLALSLLLITSSSFAALSVNIQDSDDDGSYPADQGYQVNSNIRPNDNTYPANQGYQVNPNIRPNGNTYPANQGYQVSPPTRSRGLLWVPRQSGQPLPPNAVVGGFVYNTHPRSPLYICRAFYNGGVHPGKLYAGRCNIGWGEREVVLSSYEVLVSQRPLGWTPARFGQVPDNAVLGGYQQDAPLYICRARYRNGLHPGKIVKQNCNIGWGGKEVTIPTYEVLTK